MFAIDEHAAGAPPHVAELKARSLSRQLECFLFRFLRDKKCLWPKRQIATQAGTASQVPRSSAGDVCERACVSSPASHVAYSVPCMLWFEMAAEYARPELLGVVSASLFGVYSSTTLLPVYLCLHRGKLATSIAGFQYLCRRSPGQKSKTACRSA